jgi:hypothetical protein
MDYETNDGDAFKDVWNEKIQKTIGPVMDIVGCCLIRLWRDVHFHVCTVLRKSKLRRIHISSTLRVLSH